MTRPEHNPDAPYPTLDRLRIVAAALADRVLPTPVTQWQTGVITNALSADTQVWLKLELFQKTGTFKVRGALNNLDHLTDQQREQGVVTVSAGNHAIALAYTAQLAGISAQVVMPQSASPARIERCRELGAHVILVPNVHAAFQRCQQVVEEEQRTLVHPFEGPYTTEGTATVGLEFMAQVPQLDAVIVPAGGGGLLSGVAAAVKQINPRCAVYGVEPFGADALYRSLQSGQPETLERVDTIADSLGAPMALPYSLGVCQRFVDAVVRVSDAELCQAMWHLYNDMKLVTEPATAAGTAALLGPLNTQLQGKRVGLVVCGANMDIEQFGSYVQRGRASLAAGSSA